MRRDVLAVLGTMVLSGCSVFGVRSGYDEPRYEVVGRIDEAIEIRRYALRLAAETVVSGADEEDARGAAFRILFDYISGANRAGEEVAMTVPVETAARGEKIAMTAPVETAPAAGSGYAMRFFLPASYTRESAPEPTDPRVRIVSLPETTQAVLTFSGSTGAAQIASEEERLLRALEGSAWRPTGTPVASFYDPPWTISFLRRNEVAVPVTKR
jgi:SOUL heme-binding protein